MSSSILSLQDLGIGRLFDDVRDAIVVVDLHSGEILLWNPAASKIFGYPLSEALGMRVEELVPERLRARHREGLARYREMGGGRYLDSSDLLELPALCKSGEEIRIEMSLNRISPVGQPADGRRYAMAIARDVTERTRMEQERAILSAIVESSEDAVLSKTLDGFITSWNAGAQRMYGYSPEEVLGRHVSVLAPPELQDEIPKILERLRRGESTDHYETQRVAKDGRRMFVSLTVSPVRNPEGEIIGASAIARDITEDKIRRDRMRHMAHHDPLTGLPNRTLLMDRIKQSCSRASRRGGIVAVLFLDLNGFKQINDTLGHDLGDQVLVSSAERIRRCLREEDTVARLGGDEFVVLLESPEGAEEGTQVANRISEHLSKPLDLRGTSVQVTAAVGIALGTTDTKAPEDLLHEADAAMYLAKKGGRPYQLYDPARGEATEDAV